MLYHPYPANDGKHKYYIITSSSRKVYFGAKGYEHFSSGHKDPKRKQRYIERHKDKENWTKSGIDTAGFWSRWLLWNKPTIEASYNDIKQRFLS